jgi:hypothetical protein
MGAFPATHRNPTPNTAKVTPGVRARGRSFVLQRERTQTADQGPQDDAQWQRKWDRRDSRDVGLEAATISKVRNSLPVEPSRAENDGDSSVAPQSRIGRKTSGRRASLVQRSGTGKEPWSASECVCRNE